MNNLKEKLAKIDWIQVGVVALGLGASIARSIYETKKFNAVLAEKFDSNLEQQVEKIVDKKLK